MWFTEQLGTAGTAYHMPLPVRLTGDLDVPALADAVAATVARHPVLGSAFVEQDGELWSVPAEVEPRLTVCDNPAGPVADLVRSETLRPFDLRRGPLVRFTLIREATRSRHLLLIVAHHLVFDGSSKDILVRDLGELYRERVGGRPADLPPLATSYARHATTEPARLAGEHDPAAAFWAGHWREPAAPVLPGLRRQQRDARPGATLDRTVDGRRHAALTALADSLGATRFEVLLAGVHALLYRYGAAEPTVAVDLGTRTAATHDCVGLFVNEVPVGVRPAADQSFRELVATVRAGLRERYRFRATPLARVTAGFRPRVALGPVSISYRRQDSPPGFAGLDADIEWTAFNHTARNALHLQMLDRPDRLTTRFQYSPDTLDEASVRRIAGHLDTLLAAATAAPDTPLAALDMLDTSERALLTGGWGPVDTGPAPSSTGVRPPALRAARTLPEFFVAWAAATPDAPAIGFGDDLWTYRRLDEASARLARRLGRAGVRPGDRVAVRAGRTPALLVGLLGVLRAGAAYLPLDPDHPVARTGAILADAGPVLLLTDRTDLTPACPVLPLPAPGHGTHSGDAGDDPDDRPLPTVDPDLPAYLIYTSGSTGRPKGVQIRHRALTGLLTVMRDLTGTGPGDAWLALASAAFDMSVPELFLPLVTGGRTELAGESGTRDGAALCRLIRQHRVTHVHATPSTWRLLVDAGFADPTVVGFSGAEPLPPALAREVRARVGRLWNLYGPTEATVWATAVELPDPVEAITIGRPLPGTGLYLLDDRLALVPIGVPGEVYLGGTGLADGYPGRPGLTAAHFLPDPYGPPGSRLYRTGDLGRYRPDGQVEFLGRADHQVKIRGYRVEPGEIEARLAEHPAVAACAVVLRDDVVPGPDGTDGGDPRLVGYLVRRPGAVVPEAAALRQHLARNLPSYMLPNVFVELSELPRTPNGKLDRAALPEPAPPEPVDDPVDPPGYTGLAAQILGIWRQVLRVDDIGPEDDLFDLGGHSLTVTQIAARMRRDLGVDLPLHVFFDSPTVAGLVAAAQSDVTVARRNG
ncbi:amino acid adenylation domain-containing protein [Micromonospora echinofusca]|uniref:Amino acid adenylation domain-containing protein n=2 Tax=Micromonospora echinofusca TaxID=47858 RepID=A0ABS3VJY8_MICEH|nr:amino acid adenylation domain-containing protein [Micromonospora echinofusca]